ncbi:hypothetical protein VSDG_03215 [Cytospora chrysosperma]|uniref:Putative gamma-glutamylcyclotransferase n=1 Tax=Cytospora chrysosperma TaxID=252740 RepID=A0A423WB93_CYTCH|nr:hypothetical protein VSDG_03215 [Valsa sordida]
MQTGKEMDRPDAISLKDAKTRKREGKELYFFYGSLMDPSVLQGVLGLPERPVLKPAGLYGWHMKMWGRYPVLTDEGPIELTRGMVYEVEGSELKDRLAAYETERYYREQMCEISIDGVKETVTGKTFVWAGDLSGLREGKFDLKDWQMERVLVD